MTSTHGEIGATPMVATSTLLDGLIGTPIRLIVNPASVNSIDGSGLDVLVGAHRRATAAGTQLLLRHPNEEVAHLLAQNGLRSDGDPRLVSQRPRRSTARPPR